MTPVSTRYVYGFARAKDVKAIAEPGIGEPGAPVEIVSRAGLAALVSDAPPGDVPADRRNLDAHSRVLQAAFESFPVLPMRFGVVVPDDGELEDGVLARGGDEIGRLLAEVEGRAEHRVTAYYNENVVLAEIVADNPPVARLREQIRGVSRDAGYYLRIRLGELVAEAMRRKRRDDESHILQRLRPLAAAHAREEELPEAIVVKASFLIEQQSEEDFDRAVKELAGEARGRMRFKRVGPLPPYSFVDVHLPALNGAGPWAS